MGESNNVDLFDPLAIMDSDVSLASSVSEPDFAFAFNDRNFSDRVLRIEMVPDLLETKTSCDSCTSIVDWARNRKRRREDIKKDNESVCTNEVISPPFQVIQDGAFSLVVS